MDEISQQLIKELTRTVDKLSDTFSDNQQRQESATQQNAKYFEALTREGRNHYESLKTADQKRYDDLSAAIRKEHDKEVRRQRLDAYIIAAVSVFSICISVVVASYWSLEEHRIGLKRVQLLQGYNIQLALQNKIQYLQGEIDTRFSLRNRLMDAMVRLRGLRAMGQRDCVNGKYAGKDPLGYQQRSYVETYNLVGVFYETTGVFSDKIVNSLVKFSKLASADAGSICAKSAATEETLRPLQGDIDDMIIAEIKTLEDQRKETMTKLQDQILKEDKEEAADVEPQVLL